MTGSPDNTAESLLPNRAIVILGSFNPAIIQPSFLRRFKILSEQEIRASEAESAVRGENASIAVEVPRLLISGGQTILIFKSLLFDIKRDKFEIRIKGGADHSIAINGLKKLFSILEHTPVTAIGFNFHAHWKTEEGKRKLNHLFTGDSKKFRSVFGDDVTVGGRLRFEDLGSKVLLETERSYRVADGVFFNFNFHYDLPPHPSNTLLRVLPFFEKTMERAKVVATSLYGAPSLVLPAEDTFAVLGEY